MRNFEEFLRWVMLLACMGDSNFKGVKYNKMKICNRTHSGILYVCI